MQKVEKKYEGVCVCVCFYVYINEHFERILNV